MNSQKRNYPGSLFVGHKQAVKINLAAAVVVPMQQVSSVQSLGHGILAHQPVSMISMVVFAHTSTYEDCLVLGVESSQDRCDIFRIRMQSFIQKLPYEGIGSVRHWMTGFNHDLSSASDFTIVSSEEPEELLDSSTILPMKKTGKAAFHKRLRRIPKPSIVSHTLLYGLHVLLILMHIMLLIVNHYGIARSVKVKLGRATTILSISLSIGSQTFAIVYLTILLYITQRLALRQILYSTETITGIHDRQTAWSGLGSAINSCWNQMSISASVWGVGIITVYLALMAGLKITTPSLLTLASVPQNYAVMVDSKLNDPFLLETLQVSPPASVSGGSHTIRRDELDWDPDGPIGSSPSIVRLLQKLKSQDSGFGSGLQDNMMYNVLKNNSGVGTADVNSYMMNVSCGILPGEYTRNVTESATPGQYVSDDGSILTIPSIAPNVLNIDSWDVDKLMLLMSFNVVDSTEKPAPQILLDPPMNPFDTGIYYNYSNNSTIPLNPSSLHALNMSAIYNFNVSSISVFSCFLTVSNSTIPWRILMMSGLSTNFTISSICNRLIPLGPDESFVAFSNLPACQYLSQAESFILDAISVSPSTNQSWLLDRPISSDNAPSVKIATVPLHKLEKAIEDYTAKLFWSALYLSDLRNTGLVPVFMTEIVSELQINLLPVIAGLVLSILLLIIAPVLVGWKYNKGYPTSVDNLGILETLWLGGAGGPEIAAVEDPSSKHLRCAGMFASADLSTRRRWAD
ncbi:hypothetical protein C8J56DRAFT_879960 [Mycena floridula]|nr:hypothetical protein C8J56DRAFT_879960 [Mycena floridula]